MRKEADLLNSQFSGTKNGTDIIRSPPPLHSLRMLSAILLFILNLLPFANAAVYIAEKRVKSVRIS